MTARTWLRHGESGGFFHCPDEVVNDFAALGWAPSEAPPEFNPATAEMPTPQPPVVAEIQPEPGKKSGATSKGSE